MYIEYKKSRTANKPLFIFSFESQSEYKTFIDGLREFSTNRLFPKTAIEDIEKLITIFNSRCDGKYAHDDVALTAMLFGDEMCYLNIVILPLVCMMNDSYNRLDDVCETMFELHQNMMKTNQIMTDNNHILHECCNEQEKEIQALRTICDTLCPGILHPNAQEKIAPIEE